MTDTYTGADLFVDALDRYGVEYLFGNPGTTELPIVHALEDSSVEYILGLHEDIALGMAAGYATRRRFHAHHDPSTTPVGVVNLHVAPGLAHALGNLHAANFSGVPLVVTAGNHAAGFRHKEPILGGELAEMADQFTKWSADVPDVGALPTMVRRAFRVALTPPTGPVFLSLPLDVMMAETDDEPERLGSIPNGGRGDPDQIDRAADLLVDADDIAFVVGDGIAHSGVDAIRAAVEFAEAAGARVHGEVITTEIDFPSDHDQWVSYLPTSEDLIRSSLDADTIVFAGCSTNTTVTRNEAPLLPDDADLIHISDDAWQVGKNEPADAAIIGDPGLVLYELTERVDARLSEDVRESRLERVTARRERLARKLATIGEGGGDDPRASKADLVDAMRAVAEDAYIVDESITAMHVLRNRWTLEPEQYAAGKGGGLGYGLPGAVGAALAEEHRENPRDVIGFIGDGSYLYYPHTMYSAMRYDIDVTVVVADNRNYRILKDNTLALMGGAEEDYEFIGMDFDPPYDIPMSARSQGVHGRLVEHPDEIEGALDEALSEDGATVLDVLIHD